MALQMPAVDDELVEKIVDKVKSQGIFDQFRKDCLADVDSRPAYQNLRDRVNGAVANFLSRQRWKDDLNKNKVRDSLRRHVTQGSCNLEAGVNKIVEQVVNPKTYSVIMPKVEDIVYQVMGIEKPSNSNERGHNRLRYLMSSISQDSPEKKNSAILPSDLDPVSPGSINESENEIQNLNETSKVINDEIDNMSRDVNKESNFENDNSNDSKLSGISELSSHGSTTKLDISESAHLPGDKLDICNSNGVSGNLGNKDKISNCNELTSGSLEFDNFSNLKEKLMKTDPLNKNVDRKTNVSLSVETKVENNSSETKINKDELLSENKETATEEKSVVKSPFPYSEDSVGSNASKLRLLENESTRNSAVMDCDDSSISFLDKKMVETVSCVESLKEESQMSVTSNDSRKNNFASIKLISDKSEQSSPDLKDKKDENKDSHNNSNKHRSSRDSSRDRKYSRDDKKYHDKDKHSSYKDKYSSRSKEDKYKSSSRHGDKKDDSRRDSRRSSNRDDKNGKDEKDVKKDKYSSEKDKEGKSSRKDDHRSSRSDHRSSDSKDDKKDYKSSRSKDDPKNNDKKSSSRYKDDDRSRRDHKSSSDHDKKDKAEHKDSKSDYKSSSHKRKSSEKEDKDPKRRKNCSDEIDKKEERRSRDRDDGGHRNSGSSKESKSSDKRKSSSKTERSSSSKSSKEADTKEKKKEQTVTYCNLKNKNTIQISDNTLIVLDETSVDDVPLNSQTENPPSQSVDYQSKNLEKSEIVDNPLEVQMPANKITNPDSTLIKVPSIFSAIDKNHPAGPLRNENFLGFEQISIDKSLEHLGKFITCNFKKGEMGFVSLTDDNLNNININESDYSSIVKECSVSMVDVNQTGFLPSCDFDINRKHTEKVGSDIEKEIKAETEIKSNKNLVKDNQDIKVLTNEVNLNESTSSERCFTLPAVTEDMLDNFMMENIGRAGGCYNSSDSEEERPSVASSAPKNTNSTQNHIESINAENVLNQSNQPVEDSSIKIEVTNETKDKKTPPRSSQRYGVSDLYKPRPLITNSSRRNRVASKNETDLTAATKRTASNMEFSENKRPR